MGLLRHPSLRRIVDERDRRALTYLTGFTVEAAADGRRNLILRFARNPLFSNRALFREFGTLPGCSSVISWREGQRPVDNTGSDGPLTGTKRMRDESVSGDDNVDVVGDDDAAQQQEQPRRAACTLLGILSGAECSPEIADLLTRDFWNNPLDAFLCVVCRFVELCC